MTARFGVYIRCYKTLGKIVSVRHLLILQLINLRDAMEHLVVTVLLAICMSVVTCEDPTFYSNILIDKYSENGMLVQDDFKALYSSLNLETRSPEPGHGEEEGEMPKPKYSEWCQKYFGNSSCTESCDSEEDIFNSFAMNSKMNASGLTSALPRVLVSLEERSCRKSELKDPMAEEAKHKRKPSPKEVWGYGFGFVVAVVLISNLGAFMAPLMNTKFFQKLLMFLVSVAVGTLAATGLLVLVPESMDLMAFEEIGDYMWKTSAVLASIMGFYLFERLMKIGVQIKKKSAGGKDKTELTITNDEVDSLSEDDAANHNHSHGLPLVTEKGEKPKRKVRTVAWMMLLGDGLHKFVDGLSVGAAFSQSLTTGLSLSIAIMCEELPHELGDVAILLHSGMSMKKALLCNTLSAAFSSLGLVAGVFVGNVGHASQWVFAVAGGIFLYVPLVDMLPEMSHAADKAMKEGSSPLGITFLQMIGLFLGFAIIIVVSTYAGNIQI